MALAGWEQSHLIATTFLYIIKRIKESHYKRMDNAFEMSNF